MKISYHVVKADTKYCLLRVLNINETVCFEELGRFNDLELAEDAIPANSVQSGNIAGASGDEPPVRLTRRRKKFQRIIARLKPI